MPSIGLLRERLRSGLGLTDEQAAELITRIAPVVLLEALDEPENQDTFDERLCHADVVVAAGGATTNAIAQLRPPAQSGVIALVQQVAAMTESGAAGTFLIRHHDTALTTAGTRRFRDRRITGQPATLTASAVPVGGVGDGTGRLRHRADETIVIGDLRGALLAILGEGHGYCIQNNTTNEAINVSFWWRELSAARRSA